MGVVSHKASPQEQKAVFNWSGGKDSSLALEVLLAENRYKVSSLFTTLSDKYRRVSQHGVREELLDMQAAALGVPLRKLYLPETPSMEDYDRCMAAALKDFLSEGVGYMVFGDIFLEDLRQYREKRLAELNLQGLFPLWKRPTVELAREFADKGYKAVVVCVDEKCFDKDFAGREYDHAFISGLPRNVDPCGENGEFHTFVYDGPIFQKPVPFVKGDVVYRTYPLRTHTARQGMKDQAGFWYCDLI